MAEKIKYILVSQGIKIYETTNKEEADRIMKERNDDWNRSRERCIEDNELYADNEIFMFEEHF